MSGIPQFEQFFLFTHSLFPQLIYLMSIEARLTSERSVNETHGIRTPDNVHGGVDKQYEHDSLHL